MSYSTLTQEFTGQAASGFICWCGIQFAVPKALADHYRHKNDEQPRSFSIYCPLGHGMVPAGKSVADQLRDQLAREKHWREQAEARSNELYHEKEHIEMRRRGTLGALRKVQKRVKHGVCPCCNRTFQNLGRHMTTKHPHFGATAEAP